MLCQSHSRSKSFLMAPSLKLCYLACTYLFGLAVANNITDILEKKPPEGHSKNVTKRHNILGDFGAWDPEIALLQAGLFIAENTFEVKALRLAEQLLHHGIVIGNHKNIHQQQELATAPPRNPTKPIYHYTPLPQGTFPLPKPENSDPERYTQYSKGPPNFYGKEISSYPTGEGYNLYSTGQVGESGFPSPYLYAPSYTSLPYWSANSHPTYYH